MTTVKNTEPDHSDNEMDVPKLDDYGVCERLVWHWLQIFKENRDFEKYCEAKRRGKALICSESERKHPRIAELYDDWGDIHSSQETRGGLSEWESWASSKRHLFGLNKVTLAQTGHHVPDSIERVNIQIPKGFSKEQLCKRFDEFLRAHPELLGDGPKYEIVSIRGQTHLHTLNRIEQASVAYDLCSGEGDFKYTYSQFSELVLKVKALSELGFDWFPHGDQASRLAEGTLPSSDLNNYKRQIIRLNKFYLACVESTLLGVFPASVGR